MTLHEAIELVLRESGKGLRASEIAESINKRKLYTKGDKSKVLGGQISARVNNYRDLFKIENHHISLYDLSIKPYKDFVLQFANLLQKMTAVADAIKVQDLTSSFLFLIYNWKIISDKRINDIIGKYDLKVAFDTLETEFKLDNDFFSSTKYFITNSISAYEFDKIISLIDSFSFDKYPKPSLPEFSNLINDTVNAFSWKTNFRGGETSTPKLISTLMCSIYEPNENSKIFDPFAGRAGILTDFIRNHKSKIGKIVAGEVVQDSLNMGVLNILSTGFNSFRFENRNAFTDWYKRIEADLIISNPPFSGKLNNPREIFEWQTVQSNDISLNSIQLSIYNLNEFGKAIIVVPESVLFNTNNAAITTRKMLITNDLLHGIILLPKTIYKPYASINTALLIIDKNKSSRSTGIFMYDSSSVQTTDFKSEIDSILSSFHGVTTINDKARWVPREEIQNKEYDLTVKKYIHTPIEGDHFVFLKLLLKSSFTGKHLQSTNLNNVEGIPLIQVRDLKDGEALDSIERANLNSFISLNEFSKNSYKEIPKNSILIAKVGNKLKPTLFDESFQAIASPNIIVLEPAINILPEYLVSQLQSEYILNQVEIIRRYNGIPNISLHDILNIKIKVLPFEEQKQYVSTYYSRKILNVEKSESKAKDDELYNIISRIKHEVKQPVSSIGIDISILFDYLKNKEISKKPILFNDYALEPLAGQTEKDIESTKINVIIDRIKKCVIDAQETLQKAEESLNIGKGNLKMESFEIKNHISSVILPIYVNSNITLEVLGEEQTILADQYQMKVLFKHLIDNAIKHSFNTLKNKDQNIIIISISKVPERGYLEIIVMNNGNPFQKGFNKASFETRGETNNRDNGSGFGGFHIKRIIENHKGEFQIADEDEIGISDFKVKFKIYLPLNL